jgi:two-component system KDP operon response regulator KdpE
MSEGRVLVVDDDPQILRAVRTSLQGHGHEVLTAGNGETALEVLPDADADLVILDLGLPGIEGHEVIRRVRAWSDVPIIVLSVRESQRDKVAAFEAGADDYVTKPFGMPELLARMRAVRRRAVGDRRPPVLHFGGLEVDLGRQLVRVDRGPLHLTPVDRGPLHLTPTEYRLLEAFVTNPGKLLTHRWLLQRVWGSGYASENQYLRVFIRQLRQKLDDDPARPRFIVTESGLGYRWRPDPDEETASTAGPSGRDSGRG